MTTWQPDTLAAITNATPFHIAPYRADGGTRTPTQIWSVTVDNTLYVRAYNGTSASWYQAAAKHRGGIIQAAGTEHEVTFTPVDPGDTTLHDRIDAAYHDKYDPSPYVDPMLTDNARAATFRVEPRA